jgi:RNA polymerase sigma factor (sigma-70 family)
VNVNKATANASPLIEKCADECLDRGWRLAWLMLRHREDAADAVQQAFVVALTKGDRVPADNPWPWLAAVIARECQYIRRKRSRATTNLGTVEPSMSIADTSAAQPHAELEHRERRQQITRALDELPVEERDALLLAKLGGLTYAEVAEALNVPLGTINHRISRALATLRRRLRDEDESEVAVALAALPIVGTPAGLPESLKACISLAGAAARGGVVLGGVVMKKTSVLLCALIVALLVGAGVVAVLAAPTGDDAASQVLAHSNSNGEVVRKALPGPSTQANVAMPANGGLDSEEGNRDPDTSSAEPDSPIALRRILIASDPSGAAVSLKFVVDWRISEDDAWTTQQVTTDADGRAQLDAPLASTLRVNLDDPSWVLGWRNFLIKAGEAEAPIKVYRVRPLRIRVTYADGKPYAGLLTVKAAGLWQASVQMEEAARAKTVAPPGWPMLEERATLYFHEIVEFAGLPSEVEITFETHPTRSGYSIAKHSLKLTAESTNELVEVVVPEGVAPNTPGKIVLTLDEGAKLERPSVLFKVLPDGTRRTSAWNSRDPLVSGKVWPARYIVFILGDLAWHSDEFELAAGETIELRPQLKPSCAISAKVVNDQGEPIEGAALAFATRDLPRTNSSNLKFSKAFNGETVSSADGKLKLAGLPAGTFEFQVYARGMQPWTGFATLVAQQDFDIGDIRLEAAKGRVEVQLPDWDYKVRKVTWSLSDPEGHTINHANVESSVLILEGLPVGRTYELKFHISVGQGGRAWWYPKKFELTLAAPTIKLDGTDKKWPSDLD